MIAVMTLGLLAVGLRGTLALSTETVAEFRRTCSSSFDQALLDPTLPSKTVTVRYQCDPRQVTRPAPWRWHAVAITEASIAAAGAILWLFATRLPRRARPALTTIKPLRFKVTRRGRRYRVVGVWRPMLVTFSLPFVVGGLLLGVLPSGAPPSIVLTFLATGAFLWWISGSGTVWLTDERLVVRTLWRRRTWNLTDLCDARSVTAPVLDGRQRGERLELTLTGLRRVEGCSSGGASL